MHVTLLPDNWPRPKGYANGIVAEGTKHIFCGGQIGWNSECIFETAEFVPQLRQALLNVRAVLSCADAGPEHMTRMTWYITDRQVYLDSLREIGQVYRDVMGKNYPAMSVVEVSALIEAAALVEVEVTAIA
tara:strand:- start:96 stop:488 length:393 start_codon:yes stop_codon:yes gene_type:complete